MITIHYISISWEDNFEGDETSSAVTSLWVEVQFPDRFHSWKSSPLRPFGPPGNSCWSATRIAALLPKLWSFSPSIATTSELEPSRTLMTMTFQKREKNMKIDLTYGRVSVHVNWILHRVYDSPISIHTDGEKIKNGYGAKNNQKWIGTQTSFEVSW